MAFLLFIFKWRQDEEKLPCSYYITLKCKEKNGILLTLICGGHSNGCPVEQTWEILSR